MAPEETGKDVQDDENNTMVQKHVQVVFAADIEEAAAFELLNNLCHSSSEKLDFCRCSRISSAVAEAARQLDQFERSKLQRWRGMKRNYYEYLNAEDREMKMRIITVFSNLMQLCG